MSRLSEILGVEEGQEFTFDKNGLRSIYLADLLGDEKE